MDTRVSCFTTTNLLPETHLIASAIVKILVNKGGDQVYITARALLDTCSSTNFVTEALARRLQTPMRKCAIPVGAIDSTVTLTNNIVQVTIQSSSNDFRRSMTCLTIPKIADFVPSEIFPRESIRIPANIKLADPEFHLPRPIDILIGSGHAISMFSIGQIQLDRQLCLQKTVLGWIVAGSFSGAQTPESASCNMIELDNHLIKLWSLDDMETKKAFSPEETTCERYFVATTTRNSDGRYVVRLPFRETHNSLGHSRNVAYLRYLGLERKLNSDPELKIEYSKVMQEYIDLGHMSYANDEADVGFYLPHRAVIKSSSRTTKVRVVFDASAKSDNGLSLNDNLMTGPTIQEKLFLLLIRFRIYKFVLTADIEKMYRQVLLHQSDRIYQRVLWRVNNKIRTLQLNTLTFGVSSSPYLAIRVIHQLAEDEIDAFPLASRVIRRDLYVDDLLTGADDLNTARKIRDEVITMLRRGGFNIRQWASNDPRLLEGLSTHTVDSRILTEQDPTLKTLGVLWDAREDTLSYSIRPIHIPEKVTKRYIVTEIAKIFDPLGLLAPVILYAKRIIQRLWQDKVDWDESVPAATQTTWSNFVAEFAMMHQASFDRHVLCDQHDVQLHGFCDASTNGYGACLYLRSSNGDGLITSRLLCAKSRLAPLKVVTIPRLELCGAWLLSQLYRETTPAIPLNISKTVFWSDSTIVLHWLKTSPHLLKTFVANRVSEIQQTTGSVQWRHVSSNDNPADSLSRGQLPRDFINNRLWKAGPSWLIKNQEEWPNISINAIDLPELKKVVCLATMPDAVTILERFSSWSKLIRVIAFCLRFRRGAIRSGYIRVDELKTADIRALLIVQKAYLDKELQQVKKLEFGPTTKRESNRSRLAALHPFIDRSGLLRVGGRLRRSELPYNSKYPVILPNNNPFTDLIISEIHNANLHAGIQFTLHALRQNYWILDGRNQTRRVIRRCVRCFRFRAKPLEYRMADLPPNRVSQARPFQRVGLDFCGPFYIKEKKYRNRTKIKVYICVFVCMVIKAVHLEVVSDLTTEGFLGALRRFMARRGTPTDVYSDNGTNFVGAKNHLKELYDLCQTEEINKFITSRNTIWHFIPPLSPHQGGLWESTVKQFKHHFKRVVGDLLFTFEELCTFTVEVEGILNSRPLIPLSSDPNDLSVLTPLLYLIGEPTTYSCERDFTSTPANRLSVWSHLIKIRQHFWARWKLEYLNELQQRRKWIEDSDNVAVGDLVLIKDKNSPCMSWPLGRVSEVYPGDDGVVRSALVKTATGAVKRPTRLLCPLPVD